MFVNRSLTYLRPISRLIMKGYPIAPYLDFFTSDALGYLLYKVVSQGKVTGLPQ